MPTVHDALTPELLEDAASESYRRRGASPKARAILEGARPRLVFGLGYLDGVAAMTPVIDQLKAQLQAAKAEIRSRSMKPKAQP